MENKITQYIEYLFTAALQKCGNIHDAEDLTQEVILAALTFEKRGGVIVNPKSWLSSTLNHKFYDSLRRKYHLPTISIDEVWENIEASEPEEGLPSEVVRREIAYLAKLQRDVIIKHYLQSETVQAIAEELDVPKGTVLSRLSSGRQQMRKGFEKMEQYKKQSYSPEMLQISCHGRPGLRDEPWSLVTDDMMKQNILIVAYDHPATVTQIARALGIPTPYIENAVDSLVSAELMTRKGNKVFTDFMIVSPDDLLKPLEAEIAFTSSMYNRMLAFVQDYIAKLKEVNIFGDMPQKKAEKLLYYFLLHLFSTALYTVAQKIIPSKEKYPARPDGGAWIAMGTKYPLDFDFENYKFRQYCYGGERRSLWENTFGARSIALHVYDTQPDLNKYEHGPVEIHDDNLAAMLYLISRDIPFENTGFNLMYLKDVPHLTECGVLVRNNGKTRVDIPILRSEEYDELDRIRTEQMKLFADLLEPEMRVVFPTLKIEIPKHLEGKVAEFRRHSCFAIPMAFIKLAEENGDLDFMRSTPPMVLVVEDQNEGIR